MPDDPTRSTPTYPDGQPVQNGAVAEWMRTRGEELRKEADQRRAEFFAERSDVPDLEFLTPDCPCCGLATDYDDGFYCPGCRILWPKNGYGHKAERFPDE